MDTKRIGFNVPENIGIGVFNPRATISTVVAPVCSICQVRVLDLQGHCESVADEDHLALSIHDA